MPVCIQMAVKGEINAKAGGRGGGGGIHAPFWKLGSHCVKKIRCLARHMGSSVFSHHPCRSTDRARFEKKRRKKAKKKGKCT